MLDPRLIQALKVDGVSAVIKCIGNKSVENHISDKTPWKLSIKAHHLLFLLDDHKERYKKI